jgi:putative flippase GtrA
MRGLRAELLRYLLSGGLATGVHFLVLTLNVEVFAFDSVGLANFVAAIFGSTAAFLGNRYYVFRRMHVSIAGQLARFSGLYLSMACFHGLALLVWSDLLGWNYILGFILATAIQILLSYLGNKLWVFKA